MNMNNDIIMSNPPDLQLCPSSPDAHDIFRPWNNIQPITTIKPHHQNPRKKRTKMIRFHNTNPTASGASEPSGSHPGTHSGIVTKKKPDPTAPKITRPCTECGKRFWSWKALFGHMRCHPERPWRGINPPPNIHHHQPPPDTTTEEDEYVAACLLMLANTPVLSHNINDPETRFECSSCKKVFGSHQALGGHRASHKNVKGCFAITRHDAGTTEDLEYGEHYMIVEPNLSSINQQQHKCSICLKIFPSGQALGGHKRCHLEKEDTVVLVPSHPFRFDLNSPAPPLQDDSTISTSDLDLTLHL